MIERLSTLRPLWVPGGILAAAALVLWIGRPLPPSLSGLRSTGPYAALIAAVALAWWFNRGRAFVIWFSYPEAPNEYLLRGRAWVKAFLRKIIHAIPDSRWSRCFTIIR